MVILYYTIVVVPSSVVNARMAMALRALNALEMANHTVLGATMVLC